jgi:hypothetical protein
MKSEGPSVVYIFMQKSAWDVWKQPQAELVLKVWMYTFDSFLLVPTPHLNQRAASEDLYRF